MSLSRLMIKDFRNLAAVDCIPDQHGLNIIYGHNGSGKTSLLEAIYYLGLGRSFRTASAHRLIRHSTSQFSLFAQIQTNLRTIPLGIERGLTGAPRVRINEQTVSSMAQHAMLMPIRLMHAQSHQLFEAGPQYRRHYMDWGVFYQYPAFLPHWQQCQRALKQRNVLLQKQGSRAELESWTLTLVQHGLAIDQLRRDYIDALRPYFLHCATHCLGIVDLALDYHAGWSSEQAYPEVLARDLPKDLAAGYTHAGPHRADLEISINQGPAKHFLSRGQQKLLICAMMVAQGELLLAATHKPLIYLVDDLPAELDKSSQQKLMTLLTQQQAQVFMTAINDEWCEGGLNPGKLFHVEQGSLQVVASRS